MDEENAKKDSYSLEKLVRAIAADETQIEQLKIHLGSDITRAKPEEMCISLKNSFTTSIDAIKDQSNHQIVFDLRDHSHWFLIRHGVYTFRVMVDNRHWNGQTTINKSLLWIDLFKNQNTSNINNGQANPVERKKYLFSTNGEKHLWYNVEKKLLVENEEIVQDVLGYLLSQIKAESKKRVESYYEFED